MTKSEETAHQVAEKKTKDIPPYDNPSHCLICGPVLLFGHWICDHCKNVVQPEARAQKGKIIKEGGGPG